MQMITVASLLRSVVEQETWRSLDFAPSYQVSSWGNVQGPRRLLSPTASVHGYLIVSISVGHVSKNYRVHRLVAHAFHGEPPFDGAIVAHNDGNKENCRADNLRWASARENQLDINRHGRRCAGSRVHNAKLTETQIPQIRERLRVGESQTAIAKDYGVSKHTIHLISKNRVWKSTGGAAWKI